MAGLLDAILGSADESTKDEYGQTQAERRMPIWTDLIKAGLLAYAGATHQYPDRRAELYAQAGGALAGIPQDIQSQTSNAAQLALASQKYQSGKLQLATQKQAQDWINSPVVQQMIANEQDPIKKAALQAAVLKQDPKEIMALTQAQPVGANLVRLPNGSYANPQTGRVMFDKDGKPVAGGSAGLFDASQPNVGGVDRLNLAPLQGVPHDVALQALRVARGEIAPPTVRSNPDAVQINSLAAQVAGANGTSFAARQAFEKNLTSGADYHNVIEPFSASTQHGQEAMEAFDDLMNTDGGKYAQLMNKSRQTWGQINDPELQRKVARFEKAMESYSKEAERLISGGGPITDAVRAQTAPLTDPSKTPAQQVGLMQAMHNQSHARLAQPINQARVMRHDSTINEENIGLSPEGLSSYKWLTNRLRQGPGTGNNPAPTPTTPQNFTGPDGKVWTSAQIAAAAEKYGKTPAEVIKDLNLTLQK